MTQDNTEPSRFALPLQLTQTNYVSTLFAPISHGKTNLPAFLNKLYRMVNSSDTDPWVIWNDVGTSFIIPNSQALADHVLGRHFKHNNFASFVRQLNMYGFHKVPHLNHGVLHNDGLPEVWEFTNEHFLRDNPTAMRNIVRKKGEAEKARSAAKQHSSSSPAPQPQMNDTTDMAIVRTEVAALSKRQELIKEEMYRLASSTADLWKYARETRDRYQQQQDQIDKMIKFLSEVFIKRSSTNTELPNKVRGLLEGPDPFQELSEVTSPETPSNVISEQAVWEMLNKVFPNGKAPLNFQEILQQYLLGQIHGTQGHLVASTPASTMSPATLESDALTTCAANNLGQLQYNMAQIGEVQNWLNHMDVNWLSTDVNGVGTDVNAVGTDVNAVGTDFNAAGNNEFTEWLNDPAFTSFDHHDTEMYPQDNPFQPPWEQYVHTDQLQDGTATGQKRALEDEDGEDASNKKARV